METESSKLRAQREALHTFLTLQEQKKQREEPLAPDRKKAEDDVRQQADANRRKVDEERRNLDKLSVESTKSADGIKLAVNKSWEEVKTKLWGAGLTHLLSDPRTFKVGSDGLGDPAQALRQCRKTTTDAEEAVERILSELREFNQRRLAIVFLLVVLVLVLVVVIIVATKPG